jgi:hypothetical protein
MKITIFLLTFSFVAFAISPGDIVVNEIMYNGPESGTDNEWVELFNTTASPIFLDSTLSLTDGEGTYSFEGVSIPAGGYLTIKLAENDAVPFPFTPDVDANGFGIVLSNTSDEVILKEGLVVIDEVAYIDTWGADGDGPSLERIDPAGPSSIADNWGPSLVDGGTPGAINSIYDPGGDFPPSVTEISHSPEFPMATDAVAITARITDDGAITRAKCFFSVDFAPNDSLTMFDDGAHGDGSAGDNIWGAIIPANPAGSNIRYFLEVDDDGGHSVTTWTYAYFVTTGDTLDGDLIVNEIMYNPATPMSDNYFEFIELFNRGGSAIDASGWIIKDDNDFNTFNVPAGTIIGAGEFLVIAANKDSIETLYGITGVLGPMGFQLNNTGDAVRVYNGEGTLMDYVYFSTTAPWPTSPNGGGPSLSLIDPFLDNNLADSWQASSGYGSPGAVNTTVRETGTRPSEFAILELSPNPFNAAVCVMFELAEDCDIDIRIYDINGRSVGKIFEGKALAGVHRISPDMADNPAGIYLVQLDYGSGMIVKKALLVK